MPPSQLIYSEFILRLLLIFLLTKILVFIEYNNKAHLY